MLCNVVSLFTSNLLDTSFLLCTFQVVRIMHVTNTIDSTLLVDKELRHNWTMSSYFKIGADAWWVMANDHDSNSGNKFTTADSWYGNIR